MYNTHSKTRHYNKEQKTKSRKYQTKIENSKLATIQYKTKKLNLILQELDNEIRTVIYKKYSEKIF